MAAPSPNPLRSIWAFLVPPLATKTDSLVRILVWIDVIFLLIVSLAACNGLVTFAGVLAGNAVGAIGGLLFAVPKRVAATGDGAGQQMGFVANTSLEDVSDWLTKTLIGAGLVSWHYVLRSLDRAGEQLGAAVAGSGSDLAMASGVAVILASSSAGALIGYLWFARHWPTELAASEDAMRKIIRAMGLEQSKGDVAPQTPTLGPAPPDAGGGGGAGDAGGGALPADGAGQAPQGVPADGAPAPGDGVPPPAPTVSAAAKLRTSAEQVYALMRKAPKVPHDWVKGLFGGRSSVVVEGRKRELTATVRQVDSQWFEVTVELVADPAPETEAIFFLHNTFKNPTPAASFGPGGVARLTFTAYGAFTVGALCDDGSTALELDLASLTGAPIEFRLR